MAGRQHALLGVHGLVARGHVRQGRGQVEHQDQGEAQEEQGHQPDEQQAGQQGNKESDEEKAYAAGEMTPKEAEQLLDAQKGEEKVLSPKQQGKAERSRTLRDW